MADRVYTGQVRVGAGGASKAFRHANDRRRHEVAALIGCVPVPGSLNVHLSEPFDWDAPAITGHVLDVQKRGHGLDVPWVPEPVRLYPVLVDGCEAWAFRFEKDATRYPAHFIELVAPVRLRDHVGEWVRVEHRTTVPEESAR